ncbi:twin-arginine translocase subunit TatC [Trueperella sp. LYQ141]|uniref:twin-arginine translocase subunit TatC n=1 Tax=Trueperella sp. LYQ141 TaxID=3391058 RepID=UPI003983ACBA
MPIRAHLRELRKRILWSLFGIFCGAIAGWFLYDPAMKWITTPLIERTDHAAVLNFETIGAAFDLKLRLSIWIGVLISSPWWVIQLFAFIFPGLKRREKLYVLIFGFAGILLFAAGATSGIMMAPRAVEILASFTPENAVNFLRATTYVTFYMRLVLAFGLSALLPEVLVVLNFIGILSWRAMLRAWRWAVVVCFVFAAIANPLPSPWPMTIQAFILIALYILAVGISYIHDRIIARRRARIDAALEAHATSSVNTDGYANEHQSYTDGRGSASHTDYPPYQVDATAPYPPASSTRTSGAPAGQPEASEVHSDIPIIQPAPLYTTPIPPPLIPPTSVPPKDSTGA